MRIQRLTADESSSAFCDFRHAPVLAPESAAVQRANTHLLVYGEHDEAGALEAPVARCSVWYNDTPSLSGASVGYIGHFAAREPRANQTPTAVERCVVALLDAACVELQGAGCGWAIGPVDGSTFRNYRFVTERALGGDTHPPFFLEPNQPDAWPGHFIAAGFASLAHYHSSLGELAKEDPTLDKLQARAGRAGAHIRPVNLDAFAAELRQVYAVVMAAFRGNFLYTPIGLDEFLGQFLPIRAYLQPGLAWVAEKDGRMVGFVFALPDLAQAQRGEAIDTVVIKTVGVLPDAGVIGLGHLLTAQCQVAAYGLGYRRVIHALMHDDNISSKISARYARPIRGYTLFARRLA